MKKYILILLLLAACGKTETVEPVPHTYTVTYFANGDEMFFWYEIENKSFSHIAESKNITFKTTGGWTLQFMVKFIESKSQPTMCGIVVDGDTIDGCIGGDHCVMGVYLPKAYYLE